MEIIRSQAYTQGAGRESTECYFLPDVPTIYACCHNANRGYEAVPQGVQFSPHYSNRYLRNGEVCPNLT